MKGLASHLLVNAKGRATLAAHFVKKKKKKKKPIKSYQYPFHFFVVQSSKLELKCGVDICSSSGQMKALIPSLQTDPMIII